jgi:hypothetical protein
VGIAVVDAHKYCHKHNTSVLIRKLFSKQPKVLKLPVLPYKELLSVSRKKKKKLEISSSVWDTYIAENGCRNQSSLDSVKDLHLNGGHIWLGKLGVKRSTQLLV